jgi:hypothetical protein
MGRTTQENTLAFLNRTLSAKAWAAWRSGWLGFLRRAFVAKPSNEAKGNEKCPGQAKKQSVHDGKVHSLVIGTRHPCFRLIIGGDQFPL